MDKVVLEPITPEVIRKAEDRAAAVVTAPTAIFHADVSALEGTFYLRLVFRDRTRLFVPTSHIEEIADVKPEALEHLEVSPARDAISFPEIDADITKILQRKAGSAGSVPRSPGRAPSLSPNALTNAILSKA